MSLTKRSTQAILIAVVIVIAVVSVYYFTRPEPTEEVTIGVVLAKTGTGAYAAERAIEGIDLALEEINAAGGIKSLGGLNLTIVVEDSQSDPKTAGIVTERIITEENPPIIFGDYLSGDTLVISDVCERYGVPLLSFAGSPQVTSRGLEYTFRTHPHIEHYQRPGFEVAQHLGLKKIAIMYDDSAWGTSNRDFSLKLAPEYGMDIVFDETYTGGLIDFSPVIIKLKNTEYDALFTAAYLTDALLFVRQLREQDCNVPMNIGFAVGYQDTTFFEKSGDDGEYCMFYTVFVPEIPTKECQDFVDAFQAKYGKVPDPLAEWGYSDMKLIADVLERAGSTDPEVVRTALVNTDFMTASGQIKFGSDGQNEVVTGIIGQYQSGGKRVLIWPRDIATGDIIYPIPDWADR